MLVVYDKSHLIKKCWFWNGLLIAYVHVESFFYIYIYIVQKKIYIDTYPEKSRQSQERKEKEKFDMHVSINRFIPMSSGMQD